ncbi:MAG: aldose 1-epimerase family protein [Chloroflexi bacterium]|nr:aldose 1-epimerase family protein [Chloroflexota bacterium]
MSRELPTGTQWEIRHGAQHAVVVEVGAALREYAVGDRPVLDGFPSDRMPDGGRGQPLLPWPNRLADGQYQFGGRSLQVPIDEVGRNNASHGLTRWLNWRLASHTDSRVELELIVHPRPGYPFTLGLTLTYSLSDEGLTVHTRARNLGAEPLPFGAGQHPYFTVGTPTVDTAVLHVSAQARLEFDAERRLPTGRSLPVAGTEFDFQTPRAIGATVLDDCFTDLAADRDGLVHVSLSAQDGERHVDVWMKNPYTYVQVFTGDTIAPERRRQGLAIEPMTCPPNAFRTGTHVITIEPEAAVELEWGASPTI